MWYDYVVVTFPPLPPSQVKSTQFSDRGGMQGLVVVSAQPMPKVAYRSGSRDQHDRQR